MSLNLHFVQGQGFHDTTAASCGVRYPALMFQPRMVLLLVFLGILLETGWFFVALAAVLAWNALAPRLNPFDAIYYHFFAKRRGQPRVGPAPAPRRFAQFLAAVFMLAIGLSMLSGRDELAWMLQLVLLAIVALLVFGRFCVGSFTYYLVTGKIELAMQMLPRPGK